MTLGLNGLTKVPPRLKIQVNVSEPTCSSCVKEICRQHILERIGDKNLGFPCIMEWKGKSSHITDPYQGEDNFEHSTFIEEKSQLTYQAFVHPHIISLFVIR